MHVLECSVVISYVVGVSYTIGSIWVIVYSELLKETVEEDYHSHAENCDCDLEIRDQP